MRICAAIFEHPMGARNRVEIGLLCRPTRLYRLAELITWNRFLGSLKVYKFMLMGFYLFRCPTCLK
jgi:hypothetical protein